MRNTKRFVIFSIMLLINVFVLTACVTTGSNSITNQSSAGDNNINNVIKRWGAPDEKIMAPNGSALYIYHKTSPRYERAAVAPPASVNVNSRGQSVIIPNTNIAPLKRNLYFSCTIMLMVNPKDQITSRKYEGNCNQVPLN